MARTIAILFIAAIAHLATAVRGCASPVSGRLYYTRYSSPPDVNWVNFIYDGGTNFVLTNKTLIATLAGADGLVVAPDGDLIVGGGCGTQNTIYKVNPFTGSYVTRAANGGSCHMSLDVNRQRAWGGFDYSGTPLLTEIPLNPFAVGIPHTITGSNSSVGTLAWDPAGNTYYTQSGASGGGTFGIIDLTNFITKRLINLPAAHGMTFDPFTGHFILFGAKRITQVAATPTNAVVVSDLAFPSLASSFDQGTADGLGHIFVANNGGELAFIDYSRSRLLNSTNTFVSVQTLDSFLDDVAPVLLPGTTNIADLVLNVSSAPIPAQIRSNFTYVLTVSNAGPAAASGIQIDGSLPTNTTISAASSTLGSLTISNFQVSCAATGLSARSQFTITIVLHPIGGPLVSRWAVSSAETDPDFSNNVLEQTVAAPYDCVPPPQGLIAWWRGDGNTSDFAGTNSGYFTNGVYAAGLVGGAFAMDGNTTEFVVPDNSSGLRPANLTAECWVNFSFAGGTRVIMSKTYGSANDDTYAIWYGSGALNGYGRLTTASTPILSYVWTPVLGIWYHVAYTLSANSQSLYLNGELVASSLVNGAILYDSHPHIVGADIASQKVVNRFWGLIDEPSLYSRALTQTEIRSIYGAQISGKCGQPQIAPAVLGQGVTNRPYAQLLSMLHAFSPYQFTLQSGAFPPGLNLVEGLITGTPTQLGTFSFTIAGQDGFGSSVASNLTIEVVPCQPRPLGLVGWWKAENSALDELGAHNGGPSGHVTYAPGRVGNAFQFDGNSSYVGTGPWSPGTRWTIEAWVNPAAVETGRKDIAGGFAEAKDWGLVTQGGQFGVQIRTPAGASATIPAGVWPVVGTWYHLAETCDGTNARVYLNGRYRGSAPVDTNYVGTAAGTRIGSSRCCVGANDFTGLVDEVAVFNRALSDQEVLSVYTSGTGGKCPGGTRPVINDFSQINWTVSPRDVVSFQTTATGADPLYYQWLFNGIPIGFATNATLVLSNIQPSQSGIYTVTVGNPAGTTLTASSAAVTVIQVQTANNMGPSLVINGIVGRTNRVEYRDNLITTNNWQLLTNIVLPANPYRLPDTNALGQPQRFYRLILQ